MAKFFHIEMPKDYPEWMSLITNSDLYTQRAKELKDYSEAINAALSKYDAIADIESAEANAKAKLKEAEEIRKQADDYSDSKKAEADKQFAHLMAQGEQNLVQIAAKTKHISDDRTKLSILESQLAEQEKSLAKREEAVFIKASQAQSLMAEAKRLKDEFSIRLAKIKAVAAAAEA